MGGVTLFVNLNMGLYYFQMVYYIVGYASAKVNQLKLYRILNGVLFLISSAIGIYGAVQCINKEIR